MIFDVIRKAPISFKLLHSKELTSPTSHLYCPLLVYATNLLLAHLDPFRSFSALTGSFDSLSPLHTHWSKSCPISPFFELPHLTLYVRWSTVKRNKYFTCSSSCSVRDDRSIQILGTLNIVSLKKFKIQAWMITIYTCCSANYLNITPPWFLKENIFI